MVRPSTAGSILTGLTDAWFGLGDGSIVSLKDSGGGAGFENITQLSLSSTVPVDANQCRAVVIPSNSSTAYIFVYIGSTQTLWSFGVKASSSGYPMIPSYTGGWETIDETDSPYKYKPLATNSSIYPHSRNSYSAYFDATTNIIRASNYNVIAYVFS